MCDGDGGDTKPDYVADASLERCPSLYDEPDHLYDDVRRKYGSIGV